jgi:hypothetical protein
MAFIVEDGSIVEDANAYIDLTYAADYHADRGHVAWTSLSDPEKKACIIRATDYIDKRFAKHFRGQRVTHRQELQWPRLNAVTDDNFILSNIDEVPRQLKKACAEYALRAALYSELAPDPLMTVPTQDFTGADLPEIPTEQAPGNIIEKTERADVVEESIVYAPAARTPQTPGQQGRNFQSAVVTTSTIPEYPAADLLIEDLLDYGQRELVRT